VSSEEKAADIYLIKIEPCVSVLCIMCIMFLVMGLITSSYYASVSVVLALGLSAVAFAILLLAVQVRYQTKQK